MENAIETDRTYTLEEYAALPTEDGWVDELVRGWLVREPRPRMRHGRLQSRLAQKLWNYVEAESLDGLIVTGSGFVLAESPPTVRGPDVAYVSPERLPEECTAPGPRSGSFPTTRPWTGATSYPASGSP